MATNTTAFIVPTGIGASIGGFAGDASPYARELSKYCQLIVNPNVVNAACFSGINDNMLYTEGYAIDSFFKGEIALRPLQPSTQNKIGVIFDCAIPTNVLNVHINTINAVSAVYGIKNIEYELTKKPVKIDFEITKEGISTGNLKHPQTLIEAGKILIEKGCDALGVVCLFYECEENEDENYASGEGVDPVGGVEAIISHILTKEFMVPVAHAPAFENIDISTEIVDKRAASEYITPTFLPCIILGLSKAPALIPYEKANSEDLKSNDLQALIMPHDSLGSIPVLKAYEKNIPIIAVKENQTVLDITAPKLGIKVIEAEKYSDIPKILNSL